MNKLLSLPAKLNSQNKLKTNISNLIYKPLYFIRNLKKNKGQQKKQNLQQKSNKQGNNQPQNQNNFNSGQPQKQVHLTGPKILIQKIRSGNVNIIPFYLKKIKNNRNVFMPFTQSYEYKQKDLGNQAQKQKNQQKVQQTKQSSDEKDQIQNLEEYLKKQFKFKSSQLYKEKLMKKYKILQAIKATKKMTPNYVKISDLLKQFDINKLLQNPQTRSMVYRAAFYICFIIAFFLYSSQKIDKMMPYPNWYIEKAQQASEGFLHQKLSEIKQIRIDGQNKGSDTQMTLILKEELQSSGWNKILKKIGFDVQTNKTVKFDVQNPNLILDGLEKVQSNLDTRQWIKIKPKDILYTYYDAFFDTLFLATPFIGIAITYWIFTKVNPDSMMKGITSKKKSMKIQSTKDIKVRFKDVAGMENAKKQITQFVDFLKKSQKYVQMGAKIPKGALLTGPPGTGKTMLAKACAGQAGTSFFYVSGSQFVQMFVGLGASRVRQLFARARAQAPSIIFIDQIDAIGKKRQTSRNQEKDSTLNQMLVQMDGFSSTQTVIVLAATNRKDILDSALTRPGRFDRIVEITLPQIKARQDIFMVHLAPLKVNPNKPLSQLAKRLSQLTPGFSGADIANLCNQAAIIATRKKRKYIEDEDFQQASERIMAGYIKKGLSNQKTKKRVAYHEAGHAVCGWYLRGGDPLVKLTIIPRSKGALGYAQYLPKTAYIRTRSELIDQIAIMLGGTTSQQIFLGNMSSGNSDDLQKVYSLARRMIAQFGMGLKTYNMTLDEEKYVKKQSQKLCNVMDQQILEVVNQATRRAKGIIQQKRQIVQALAKELLAKETINNEDILRIMGQRPAFN